MDIKEVSLVLCVYNESTRVGPFVTSVQELPYGELIVVDGGSNDDTVSAFEGLPNTHVVQAGRVGLLSQRLLGIREAKFETLILLNVDDSITRECFLGIWDEFQSKTRIDGLQFQIRTEGRTYWEQAWNAYFDLTMPAGSTVKLLGRPCICRKSLFASFVPEDNIFNEDTWVKLREADVRREYFVSGHFATRSTPNTFGENFRQYVRYGKSDGLTARGWGEVGELLFHSFIRIGLIRSILLAVRGQIVFVPFTLLMGLVRTAAHVHFRAQNASSRSPI